MEERAWLPNAISHEVSRNPADRVDIQEAGYEKSTRQRVKQAGGSWRPGQRLWELSYEQTVALGLESRIITGDKPGK